MPLPSPFITDARLSPNWLARLERQLIIPRWSFAQQIQMCGSSVSLPSSLPVTARYLVCAGVGEVRRRTDTGSADPLTPVAELEPACGRLDGEAPVLAISLELSRGPVSDAVSGARRVSCPPFWELSIAALRATADGPTAAEVLWTPFEHFLPTEDDVAGGSAASDRGAASRSGLCVGEVPYSLQAFLATWLLAALRAGAVPTS